MTTKIVGYREMTNYERTKRTRKAKRAIADSIKTLRACVSCGEDDVVVLHVVEKDGHRRLGVGKKISANISHLDLLELLGNADIVCSNCKQKREAKYLRKEVEQNKQDIRNKKAENAQTYEEFERKLRKEAGLSPSLSDQLQGKE